jgi:hypothetical protein
MLCIKKIYILFFNNIIFNLFNLSKIKAHAFLNLKPNTKNIIYNYILKSY